MAVLDVKPKSKCKYDILSLGEIMIRLDPGDERIHTTRHFRVWEGGGEYNVARGLKRCRLLPTFILPQKKDASSTQSVRTSAKRHVLANVFTCFNAYCPTFLILSQLFFNTGL